MTNYERIKAMSVEEMANRLYRYSDCVSCIVVDNGMCESILKCKSQQLKWLESEVDT